MRMLVLVAAVLAGGACSETSSPPAPAPAPPAAAPAAPAPAPAPGPAPGRPPAERISRTWTFEGDEEGGPPAGFSFGRTGQGRPGFWVVRAAEGAPSGKRVLVQEDADPTDNRFPVALAEVLEVRDFRLSVRFRTVSGAVDQAAGLVFRARGMDDYYLLRANALEDNVVLFRVRGGLREDIAVWTGKVPAGEWTVLSVEVAGDRIRASLGGREVLDARDGTFPAAGRVGLWTKSDSVTRFDDLVVEAP